MKSARELFEELGFKWKETKDDIVGRYLNILHFYKKKRLHFIKMIILDIFILMVFMI